MGAHQSCTILFTLLLALHGTQSFGSPDSKPCLPLLKSLVEQNTYWSRDIGATNFRDWSTYRYTLAIRNTDQLFPETLIDLGSGQGYAVREAVEKRGFKRAIAIDLHDHSEAVHWNQVSEKNYDKITFETGAAEYILDHYPGFADMIVDNYGALTYSPARTQILEASFKALKSGGYAYFRIPPVSFVFVHGKSVPLELYLSQKFPKVFSIRTTSIASDLSTELEPYLNSATVLVMRHPEKMKSLDLGLTLSKQGLWIHPAKSDLRFPVVHYQEK